MNFARNGARSEEFDVTTRWTAAVFGNQTGLIDLRSDRRVCWAFEEHVLGGTIQTLRCYDFARLEFEEVSTVQDEYIESKPDAGRRLRAYRFLRDRIFKGVYGPNQRLTEMELSQELGVSRQTVGLALVRLEQEGLVITQPNRGATVRAFRIPEALRVMRIREALEGVTAALAAENATDSELREMTAIVDEMYAVGEPNILERYSALCNRLHALILEAARDETLDRILGSLNHALIRYEYRAILLAGRRERSMAEHRELVAALNVRDAGAAETAMRRHVMAVRETIEKNATLFS